MRKCDIAVDTYEGLTNDSTLNQLQHFYKVYGHYKFLNHENNLTYLAILVSYPFKTYQIKSNEVIHYK